MLPGKYICLFMVYSMLGWVYESLFCTVKTGRWENRGFLFGPACPIYGVGAVTISLITNLVSGEEGLQMWQVFLLSAAGSAVLEYVTSLVLEKLFHALWWDYSELPFNLHGRISLFTSLGFGLAGILVVRWIAPFTEQAVGHLSPLAMEYLAFPLFGIFAADLTLTVTVLRHFDKMVEGAESRFNDRMERVVGTTVQRTAQIRDTVSARQKSISSHIRQMGPVGQATVRRIRTFRHDRKEKGISNIWHLKRKASASDTEKE